MIGGFSRAQFIFGCYGECAVSTLIGECIHTIMAIGNGLIIYLGELMTKMDIRLHYTTAGNQCATINKANQSRRTHFDTIIFCDIYCKLIFLRI